MTFFVDLEHMLFQKSFDKSAYHVELNLKFSTYSYKSFSVFQYADSAKLLGRNNVRIESRATVPNVGATAHRWAIESSRGAVVDQNEFGGR